MKYKMFAITMLLLIGIVGNASAVLKMDSIQFDPAIITAGDEIDIVVQYHDEPIAGEMDRTNNDDYEFRVKLESDDTLTEEYVIIQDAYGDSPFGAVIGGQTYNKVFRVKVMPNAPAGNYEFKLTGQWYYKGEAEGVERSVKFMMNVKKEGIIINLASLSTQPAEVRAGDNYVNVHATITNTGEKAAKNIEVNLNLPSDLEHSYTDANRRYIGRLDPGDSQQVTFYVDVNEDSAEGVKEISYTLDYMDLDNNEYSKEITTPFLVKPRPYLEVVKSEGSVSAGGSGELKIYVKNTGSESAESVDVRVLKQNSQPFSFDVRSDYIGELEPGEEGLAIIPVEVLSHAESKDYDFKVMIRSKGDSDEGDDNIYTYNRRATFTVDGQSTNYTLILGIIVIVLVAGYAIISAMKKGKKTRK